MEISIAFEKGPIRVNIEASEEENYEQVLENLTNFLEENPELMETVPPRETPDPVSERAVTTESTTSDVENTMLESILSDTGIDEDTFIRLFEVGEEVRPRIFDGENVPSESGSEKVLHASSILLTIWDECYDQDSVASSELSTALEQSGLPDRPDYIYRNDNWNSLFRRQGEGRGTTLSVTPRGKDKAIELMQQMAADMNE